VLRVLGSAKTLCDRLTRRDFLRVGTLGLAGLALDDMLHHEVGAAVSTRPRSFGRSKQCILIYLFGAASQIETFDPKPDAPVEVRGELATIPTRLTGVRFCDRLPRLAGLADRLAVVRSMTHPYPIHGSAYSLTSTPEIDIPMQLDARDGRHWPFIGSVVEYIDENRTRGEVRRDGMPRNVALPWPLSTRRPHPSRNGGPYAAFLGPRFDPVWTEFEGRGTRPASYEFGGKVTTCLDPYGGIELDARLYFEAGASRPPEITLDRLHRRSSLLEQLDRCRHALDRSAARFDRHRQLALSLVTSTRAAEALDVQREPATLREAYGMNLFGQGCLAARRLIEAGTRFVTVFWDEFGSVNAGWDTHYQHYPRMKEQLLPGLDRGLASLIADLETRGLLDETLVACITEHGRTPRLTNDNGGGRDHWSRAYCSVFAGSGVARGRVIGSTDRIAGNVSERPVSPKDVLATMYHLLGVDPEATIPDRLGRPVAIGGPGKVCTELLA
jgi:hypothetical protein